MSNVLLKKKIANLEAILDNKAPVNDYLGVVRPDPVVDWPWDLGEDVTLDEVEDELEKHVYWLEEEFDYSEIADTEAEQYTLKAFDVAAADAALVRARDLSYDLQDELSKLKRQLKGRG